MATQFTNNDIFRMKNDAGSSFWRAIWTRLAAWVNAADTRIAAVEAGAIAATRFCTRSLALTGDSGFGYLSSKKFNIIMHVSLSDFYCNGVFVNADASDSGRGMTTGIYARVGYWPLAGGSPVFPNTSYTLLDPNAVNFVPMAPDTLPGDYTPVLIEGETVLLLELNAGSGESITSAVAELIGAEAAALPF